jgi:hypothetical protein
MNCSNYWLRTLLDCCERILPICKETTQIQTQNERSSTQKIKINQQSKLLIN